MAALFSGLRIASTLAVIGVTVGELVGGNKGLGFLLVDAEGQGNTAGVFVAIVMLTLIGVLAYGAVVWAEARPALPAESQPGHGVNAMSQNSLLDGRRVLLTGGARGLGYAFAEAAARAGARVVIADILEERVQRSARELAEQGLDISGLPLDLADPVSIERCVAAAVERLGGLDGLVNNASITNSGGKSCEELEIEVFDRVLQVNVRGTWLMTRACLPALRESDVARWSTWPPTPRCGAPNLLAYSASKAR